MNFQRAVKIYFLILLLLPYMLNAGSYDPSLKWRQIETNHFFIYYPSYLRTMAVRVGWMAEDIYEKLTPFMRWSPTEKTNIVLIDNTDQANGYTTFTPRNRIKLFLTPPALESQLDTYYDWLYLVLTHEFTHTLHIDQNSGLATITRQLAGRFEATPWLIFPSIPVALFPSWLHESIAVYNETKFTRGGRGRSTYADMVVYTALLDGNFPSISQLLTPPPQWPAGYLPYIFGEKFLAFLVKRYGKKALYRSFRLERNLILPLWYEILHVFAYGNLAETDWEAWKRSLWRKASQKNWYIEKDLLKISPFTWTHTAPACSTNLIFYLEDTGDRWQSIVKWKNGKREKIVSGYILPYISISKNGNEIVYSKLEVFKKYYYFSDIYLYDLKKKRESRLTTGRRLRYPVFINKNIYALQVTFGAVHLVKLNKQGRILKKYLIPGADNGGFLVYDNFNKRILLTLHKNGAAFISAFDLKSKSFHDLTDASALDFYPYPLSKNSFLFASNRGRNGFHLFIWKKGKIFKLTKGYGNFFKPCIFQGNLVVDRYTSRGFALETIPFKYLHKKEVTHHLKKNSSPLSTKTKTLPASFPEEKYNPLTTISPKAIFSTFGYSENQGFQFYLEGSGSDILNFFNLNLRLSQRISQKATDLSGYLIIDRFDPTFVAGGGSNTIFTNEFTTSCTLKESFISLQMKNDFPKINGFSRYLLITYLYDGLKHHPTNSRGSLRISFLYNSAGYFPEIWRINDGISAGATFIEEHPLFGSPFVSTGIVGDFSDYIPLWRDTLLNFELYGGTTFGNKTKGIQLSLGENNYTSQKYYFLYPSENSFNFEGYRQGSIRTSTAFALSLRFNWKVISINDGLWTIPFFLGELWNEIYTQHLLFSENTSFMPEKYLGNIGTSFTTNFVIGHLIPVYLKFNFTLKFPQRVLTGGMYISISPI